MNYLLVIGDRHSSEMDRALVRLAEWMGVVSHHVTYSNRPDFLDDLKRGVQGKCVAVAVSADTLAKISSVSEILALSCCGAEGTVPILVYGIGRSASHATALENLGCCVIQRVRQIIEQPLRYAFATGDRASLQQLVGMEFSDDVSTGCDVFEMVPSPEEAVVPLLYAGDHPVFIRTRTQPGQVDLYLWAAEHIVDVGMPVSHETRPERIYQWLLPAIVFLKACFGSRCWHNPNVRARLIIDDPLLHPRYGFLRYDALLDSMERVSYGTSLAFIPWNYRRSLKQVADLFLASQGSLSLCVHGCDHTNHEFESDDEGHLTKIAVLALQRMAKHHARSGVPHEKIMVFPQGHFSSQALRALRRSGFVAAVNTTCYPGGEESALTLGDVLRPAVCRFHGFPIFLRREPCRIIDIAVDLFLGRAGFVVEHHEFVRDGYGTWEQFASAMNDLDERLTWPSLDETITEACLQKVSGEHQVDLQFFTHVFQWRNRTANSVQVHLTKIEPDPLMIQAVQINGEPHSYVLQDGWLHCDALVGPNTSITVTVLYEDFAELVPFSPSVRHAVGVGMRRVLSELRDNHLSRHPQLLGYAKAAARRLRLTSDSHKGS